MGAYTVGEIRVKTIVPIRMIQSLYIGNLENTHANLALEAFIFEDDVEKALFHINENSGISVWASSATVQMDCEKKSRTFQNAHSTYQGIIKKVLKSTVGAKLYFYVKDREITTPLYQIEETDWEFSLD